MMHRIAIASSLAVGLALSSSAFAQNAPIAPRSAQKQTATAQNWSKEQLLTSTVHQAWLLSGKNEATFFEMVSQLAQISASNRGIQLPQTADAGRKVGEHIKMAAKKDTDQLLYAIVDDAVREFGGDDTPKPAGTNK